MRLRQRLLLFGTRLFFWRATGFPLLCFPFGCHAESTSNLSGRRSCGPSTVTARQSLITSTMFAQMLAAHRYVSRSFPRRVYPHMRDRQSIHTVPACVSSSATTCNPYQRTLQYCHACNKCVHCECAYLALCMHQS